MFYTKLFENLTSTVQVSVDIILHIVFHPNLGNLIQVGLDPYNFMIT